MDCKVTLNTPCEILGEGAVIRIQEIKRGKVS